MAPVLWIKEPVSTVAVLIVSSGDIAPSLAQRLKAALHGWDEVAYVQVLEPDVLYQQWLKHQNSASSCDASVLLGRLGMQCQLLNIENGQRGELAWLGSVRGHWLRFLALPPPVTDAQHQCARVLEVLRELVKNQLAQRYLNC